MLRIFALAVILIMSVGTGLAAETNNKQLKSKKEHLVNLKIDRAINKASRLHQLPTSLIRALIEVESGGGSRGVYAVSSANAKGLTQMLPGTAKEMGVRDLFDIEQNVIGGSGYLKKQIDKFDSLFLALVAYNWGPNNARKALSGQKRIPKSVRRYANRIIRYHYEG